MSVASPVHYRLLLDIIPCTTFSSLSDPSTCSRGAEQAVCTMVVGNQYNLSPIRDLVQMYGWDNSQTAVLVTIPGNWDISPQQD